MTCSITKDGCLSTSEFTRLLAAIRRGGGDRELRRRLRDSYWALQWDGEPFGSRPATERCDALCRVGAHAHWSLHDLKWPRASFYLYWAEAVLGVFQIAAAATVSVSTTHLAVTAVTGAQANLATVTDGALRQPGTLIFVENRDELLDLLLGVDIALT